MKKFLLSALAAISCASIAMAAEVTVDFTNPEALGVAKPAPGEATVTEGFTYEGVKVVITQGNDLGSNQELRFFANSNTGVVDFRTSANGGKKGHKFAVSMTDGTAITSISFDGKNLSATAEPGTLDGMTWTGEASTVTFTTNGVVNLNSMTVATGGSGDTPVTPPATPDDQIYAGLIDNYTDWTVDDGTLPEGLSFVWSWNSSYQYAKASAFYKQAYASRATLTSPEIDLTNREEISLSFEMLANYFNGGISQACSVLLSVDGGEFTPLTIANWATDDFKAPWTANTIDLNAYAGKKIKVQFVYTSTAETAGTWEIKNFIVKGKQVQTGIADIEAADAPAEYFNLQGVRVENPSTGIYLRRQAGKVTKVIIR
ncbi:MAG: choice-of-anchor J domain-containing protein [Duncaniella sp.]|nr:choice-of-anchor J domain-containing protein [Duncaniella sp.]